MKIRIGSIVVAATLAGVASAQYQVTNLVSDGSVPALHTDVNLKNTWGLAFNPTGFAWVANNHSSTSTLYDGNGVPQSLVVGIPGPDGPGAPTGIVYSGGSDFVVHNGNASGPARFIFAGEDGVISGWNPAVPPPPPSTNAQVAVNNSARNSIYKGLALGQPGGQSRLFATDFHNGAVNMFDGNFSELLLPGTFTDPTLPAGYAPFGVATHGDNVYVTFALQDENGEDDVPGPGHGFIDVFTPNGLFLSRMVSGGVLNSPWGMAWAPGNFGPFSGDMLVGNFGDGRINAFDPVTGAWHGALATARGGTSAINGLWDIKFGNGLLNQPTNTLFFTAGPNGEANGLYGRIDAVPEPAAVLLLAVGALAARRR